MSRVITFSRAFPAYHPKKGQPTLFVEKILNSLHRDAGVYFTNSYSLIGLNEGKEKETESFWGTIKLNYNLLGDKNHTIRSGSRWKVGDKFSPRVWSGKPYASKMITIAPDIEIKKIWEFVIEDGTAYIHNGKNLLNPLSYSELEAIAVNDGLTMEELKQWFKWPKPFKGQIICWNESINY